MKTDLNRTAIREKADQIYAQIKLSCQDAQLNIGVAGGKAGVSLFLFHYYRMSNDENASVLGLGLLYESMEQLESGNFRIFTEIKRTALKGISQ